jgi:hypothetical protein
MLASMQRSKKRFIYTHKIIFSIAALLLIVFVLPNFLWYLQSEQPLSVVVIDKTTGDGYREHRSFFWLLQHWKYINPATKSFYDPKKDYYGFFPEDSTVSVSSQLNLDRTNLLYIADTYGVYRYPMDYKEYERLVSETYIAIDLKYGGLTSDEMKAIELHRQRGGMTIAEFNTMEDPQLEDKPVEQRLEKMFGVRFTGGLGRYYDDVNTASRWMKDLYEKQYRTKWNFSGRGLIITVKRKMGDEKASVIVLGSEDLARTPVYLRKSDHPFLDGVEDAVPYFYFFEFMQTDSAARIIANFEIQCTQTGKEKMIAAGLPLSFPAVILSDSTDKTIYFAGDFADNQVEVLLTGYWNVEFLLSKLFSFYYVSDQTRFFWKFYLPMMKQVLHASAEQNQMKSH